MNDIIKILGTMYLTVCMLAFMPISDARKIDNLPNIVEVMGGEYNLTGPYNITDVYGTYWDIGASISGNKSIWLNGVGNIVVYNYGNNSYVEIIPPGDAPFVQDYRIINDCIFYLLDDDGDLYSLFLYDLSNDDGSVLISSGDTRFLEVAYVNETYKECVMYLKCDPDTEDDITIYYYSVGVEEEIVVTTDKIPIDYWFDVAGILWNGEYVALSIENDTTTYVWVGNIITNTEEIICYNEDVFYTRGINNNNIVTITDSLISVIYFYNLTSNTTEFDGEGYEPLYEFQYIIFGNMIEDLFWYTSYDMGDFIENITVTIVNLTSRTEISLGNSTSTANYINSIDLLDNGTYEIITIEYTIMSDYTGDVNLYFLEPININEEIPEPDESPIGEVITTILITALPVVIILFAVQMVVSFVKARKK